jgi:hypothetical protein
VALHHTGSTVDERDRIRIRLFSCAPLPGRAEQLEEHRTAGPDVPQGPRLAGLNIVGDDWTCSGSEIGFRSGSASQTRSNSPALVLTGYVSDYG